MKDFSLAVHKNVQLELFADFSQKTLTSADPTVIISSYQVPSIQHYRFKYGIAKHVGSSDLTVCERTARIIAGFFFYRETCFSSLLRLLLQTKSDIVTALNTPLIQKGKIK